VIFTTKDTEGSETDETHDIVDASIQSV
jgi:hypothetical protein